MPQPISTQTSAVMNSAATSVRNLGRPTIRQERQHRRRDRLRRSGDDVRDLEADSVSVTTPMTMPTVAAAAPTASAYLAPVSKPSIRSRLWMRDARLSTRCASGTITSIASSTHTPRSPNCRVISASSMACVTMSAIHCAAVVRVRDVNRPTRMHDEMPVNAARYGVEPLTMIR
jgi:hypothetical protein